MPRLKRLFAPGTPQHLILRGVDRQDIFLTEGDRIHFHRCLANLAPEASVTVHAYVLMTNHVHLLATGALRHSIPRLMHRLGTRYAGYFNYLHDRTGGLWEGRYKSTLVEAERYFLTCQRYIELNPVRARMVAHPAQYRWSSYGSNAEGRPDDLVTPHELFARLGSSAEDREGAYRELFETDIDSETLARIRDCTQHGWALGSEEFVKALDGRGSRRASRLPLGRPGRTSKRL